MTDQQSLREAELDEMLETIIWHDQNDHELVMNNKDKFKAMLTLYGTSERLDTAQQLMEASQIHNLPFATLAKHYIEKLEQQVSPTGDKK